MRAYYCAWNYKMTQKHTKSYRVVKPHVIKMNYIPTTLRRNVMTIDIFIFIHHKRKQNKKKKNKKAQLN